MIKKKILGLIVYILDKWFDSEPTTRDTIGVIEGAKYVVTFLENELLESEKKNVYYEQVLKLVEFEVIQCNECPFVKDNKCTNIKSKRYNTKVIEHMNTKDGLVIKYSAPGCAEVMAEINYDLELQLAGKEEDTENISKLIH